MGSRAVVSILHHPLRSLRPGYIAEEDGAGWHFRSALALKRYGSYKAISVRPGYEDTWIYRVVDGIPVVVSPLTRVPSTRIGVLLKLKSLIWSELSMQMISYVEKLVKRHSYIPYIHDYRSLNSELIIRRLIDHPMVLQHHGTEPPRPIASLNPFKRIKKAYLLEKEKLLRRVDGAFFVLNKEEKSYLEDTLGVDALVRIRTMGVDFNELKPVAREEKIELREKLGLPVDAVVLHSYVGAGELSTLKGVDLVPRIWKELRLRAKRSIVMIATGVSEYWMRKIRIRDPGFKIYGYMPHKHYLDLLGTCDIYFLPARPEYYYGGVGVSVMEAMAMGIPIVSPSLIHFPERDKIKELGAISPYIDSEEDLEIFIDRLIYVIDNLGSFKPDRIREIAYKYYSWESFVKDFNETTAKL